MKLFFNPVPHAEAIKFIQSLPVVTREVYDELLPEYQAMAFVITGLDDALQLQAAKDILAKLPAGADYDAVRDELIAALPFSGKKAERRADILLRHWGGIAYAAAQYRIADRQRDAFPYWQYASMGDGRVRATHSALDGLILRADSPFWKTHLPPWEPLCRCTFIPLSDADVEEIRENEKDSDPDQKSVLEGPSLRKLLEENILVRGPSMIFDVRTQAQKGKKWIGWDPENLAHGISLEAIQKKLDPDVFEKYIKFLKSKWIDKETTALQWLKRVGPKAPPRPRAKKAPAPEPEPPPAAAPGAIPAPDQLKLVKRLGGSTGAELHEAADGSQWVVKRGANAEHIREEHLADRLYAAAGLRVPRSELHETPAGPVKVAEFIKGQTLAEYLRTATGDARAETLRQIHEGFAADALLGNWDVAGLGMDNIMIDADGRPVRIDNGGSLRFRAMGAKKDAEDWTPEVTELQSLRDAARNGQTAELFKGLTDAEIDDQIERQILPAQEAILKAAGPELAGMLEARIDHLRRERVPFTDAEIALITAAGVRGHAQASDEDHVEDLNALYWTERDENGRDVTRLRLKLTESGSDAVMRAAGTNLQPPAAAAQPDTYWQQIEPVLKHVGHHAATDQVYHSAKLALLDTLAKKLKKLKKTAPEQAAHYLAQIAQIKAAAATHTAPAAGSLTAWTPPVKPAPPAARGRVSMTAISHAFKAKRLEGGRAEASAQTIWNTHAYAAERAGTGMTVIPWKINGQDSPAPYALRGYVDVTVPGLPEKARLKAAMNLLKDAGVDVTPAPAARRELLHLVKGLKINKPADASWQAIAAGGGHDHEKAAALRGWIKDNLQINLPAPGRDGYHPGGEPGHKGRGWNVSKRWDISAEQIKKALPGYGLTHESTADFGVLVRAWLNNGGQVTNTVERLRTGIGISSGLSPSTDLGTGGANYLFTRIKPPDGVNTLKKGFIFKRDALQRMDSVSYDNDYYGNVTPAGQYGTAHARATTPEQWKANSLRTGNETLFKNGLDLLQDLQEIRCTVKEKKDILATFKEFGITKLPDGRAVTDLFRKSE